MGTDSNTSSNRVYFFDNLRYFMVLMVVVLHSAGAYNQNANRPVKDQYSIVYDAISLFLDVFLMPSLFFIAGYFALPSLHQKNTWEFIKSKLKRLGIPFLIGIIIFGPLRNYIWEYSRDPYPVSLWEHFLRIMNRASVLHLPHYYLWFISLLLMFFILFALSHEAKEKLFPGSLRSEEAIPSKAKVLSITMLFGIMMAFFGFLLQNFYMEREWVILGNLVQFQVVRIALYILSFSMGVYAFNKRWFENRQAPGHFMVWAVFSVVLYVLLIKTMITSMTNPMLYPMLQMALIQFLRTFLFLAVLFGFISFGVKYWDSASRANRLFAENSYNIYLLHLIIVFLAQLVLVKSIDGFIHLKFLIVCLVSISMSLLISRYAVARFPKAFIAGLVGLFIVLLLTLSPKEMI